MVIIPNFKIVVKQPLTPAFPFPEGYVLPVDKPLGWTSSDVVRKLRVIMRKIGYRKIKVGHAGTLDPLATGVLIICIGRATKRVDELQAEEKEYLTTIRLGATTVSCDLEHPIDKTYPYDHVTQESIEAALREMEGEQLQEPPLYSAKKIEGQRAYEYAREGEEVKLRHALINIYEMRLEQVNLPDVTLRIRCSKGTYIRSIARDLGNKLECGGHLIALRRTRSGAFAESDLYTIEEIEKSLLPEPLQPFVPSLPLDRE